MSFSFQESLYPLHSLPSTSFSLLECAHGGLATFPSAIWDLMHCAWWWLSSQGDTWCVFTYIRAHLHKTCSPQRACGPGIVVHFSQFPSHSLYCMFNTSVTLGHHFHCPVIGKLFWFVEVVCVPSSTSLFVLEQHSCKPMRLVTLIYRSRTTLAPFPGSTSFVGSRANLLSNSMVWVRIKHKAGFGTIKLMARVEVRTLFYWQEPCSRTNKRMLIHEHVLLGKAQWPLLVVLWRYYGTVMAFTFKTLVLWLCTMIL